MNAYDYRNVAATLDDLEEATGTEWQCYDGRKYQTKFGDLALYVDARSSQFKGRITRPAHGIFEEAFNVCEIGADALEVGEITDFVERLIDEARSRLAQWTDDLPEVSR